MIGIRNRYDLISPIDMDQLYDYHYPDSILIIQATILYFLTRSLRITALFLLRITRAYIKKKQPIGLLSLNLCYVLHEYCTCPARATPMDPGSAAGA